MKDSKAAKPASTTTLKQQFSLRLREGGLILLLALCVYMLMALTTYHGADPGWSSAVSHGEVRNAAGRSGAWFSDLLLSLFGYFAYLFPLILGGKCWQLFRGRHHASRWRPTLAGLRLAGLIATLVSGAALATLHISVDSSLLPETAGGILGGIIANGSLDSLGRPGLTLVLVSCFLVGVTVFTDLSWLKLMDRTGTITLNLLSALMLRLRRWKADFVERRESREIQKVKQERKVVIAQEVKRQKAREPVKIAAPVKKLESSKRVVKERQASLFDEPVKGALPPLSLLDDADKSAVHGYSAESLEGMSKLLELKLKDFGVIAEVVAVHPGPVVTRFEIQPAAGVKVSKITNLAKDLARSLAVISVRVVEVIPGKSVVGIEIPNEDRNTVYFSEVVGSPVFDETVSPVGLALGHDIGGAPVVVNLAKMPHLLVAGTTGSGKSVGVNAMILSILLKASPEEVRLIMVDPKMLELSIYDGIPHLLTPVVTDMKDAANALRWCVAEMERRYKLMAAMGVRNIAGYNRKVKDAEKAGEPLPDPLYDPIGESDVAPTLETLPFIVVVVDEFADMIMVVGKKVEELIARIAQKARAAGIHLILATQRPSVDVITGLIKANVPTRIAFQVSSKIDSRTILDQGGAEQLLGHGDMLYLPPGSGVPVRVHGAFVSDDEVHRVVDDWKKRGEPDFIDEILSGASGSDMGLGGGGDDGEESDALYDQAVAFITETRRASISSVQRKFKIGYNRAARLIESMEMAGVVSSMGSNGGREVLAPPAPRD
ncbi:DNA translocase FtsK [Aestuariirhabdus sp. LZHN29]|uniref:DNA translocase FtsK n=1 Tax=Aestuariirhabdus sp. LZHN29 TaxID=3417462 RepID=UPI003CF63991